MLNSKEVLKEANIMPKLKLAIQTQGGGVKGTGPHRVKILSDEKRKDIDRDTGKEIDVIRFIFEEDHEKKYYDVDVLEKKGRSPLSDSAASARCRRGRN
jgi:hypothetical protein